jgi:hypothetical protein
MSRVRPSRAVAAFDSATAMLRATANALRGKDFPHVGQSSPRAFPVRMSGLLPVGPRRTAYAVVGAAEGVRPEQLAAIDMSEIASWVAEEYPSRPYPAVVLGSSNGALVHLCAAMGVPWLPQTVLVPVRWGDNDPDDPAAALRFGASVAGPMLERNPDVVLHHMHDGNQDRLMVSWMTYFRLKYASLPVAYARFLESCLAPGAPVIVLDDRSSWPITQVAERHVFQTGAQGGIDAEEYLYGSMRVADFLHAQGSPRRRFVAPDPDGRAAEAEWGLDPSLAPAVARWASRTGHPFVRVRIPSPQSLSAPVASLLRSRLSAAGVPGDRLLVSSFIMLDPVQAERTGSVPYWTFFGVEPARRGALRFVASADVPYRDADVLVFPHGVESAGIAQPSAWGELGQYLTGRVRLLGGTAERWPAHFDTLARYGPALRALPTLVPSPLPPLDVRSALTNLAALGVDVRWVDPPPPVEEPRRLVGHGG